MHGDFLGGAVYWKLRLQKCLALSIKEDKYISAIEVSKEFLWMKKFQKELGVEQEKFTLTYDNHSPIHIGKNLMSHSRFKHIILWYHWIWDALETKPFSLKKIHTYEKYSYMMTKILLMTKMSNCIKKYNHDGAAPFHLSREREICIVYSLLKWDLSFI